jgi:hypothetical protein
MTLVTSGSVASFLASLAGGILGSYAAFYFRGALPRREQVARSLADFYSSAAAVYYARREYRIAPESDKDHLSFYKLYDQHYKEFLSASTYLASLVPPTLREEVLGIEDAWEEINDGGFAAVPEKFWFDALDAIRYKILDSVRYSRLTDPYVKS